MEVITLNNDNINCEHICCSLSDKKGECGVYLKKEWLKERFHDGLVFNKINVRGKAFIEYIPLKNAWVPIEGYNYMFINCFWVSGKFKGQGYGNKLLMECINDSKKKGKDGIIAISSKKKMPFLSDADYLKYKGFKVCDTAAPYYELLYLSFYNEDNLPKFNANSKLGKIDEKGLILYYSNQCPFTSKYVDLVKNISKEKGIDIKVTKFESKEQAQSSPCPFTTYSLFYNGEFITNEILSEKKFIKLISEKGLV
ncbi:MAG: YoaP domain-containing protein [Clostridium sp.]|uniref:N-acetyltransferase n=1 Tax=Clostridium sp. TaxID=1506 RepID=UPI0025C5ECF0|nr:GNAT family N-acetyltransferase [Clostridium sp.]MCF0147373.1 YoaP domain-containing protein [Clostridium sp.]